MKERAKSQETFHDNLPRELEMDEFLFFPL
jgi:hypothetical protein